MTFDHKSLELLGEALRTMDQGFRHLPESAPAPDLGPLRDALREAAERMRDNYPYQHPLYIGQMLKPPHSVARLAYALAMFVNPNNHALDGGRASSAMEKEAVAQIARMFGWETHLGHLCGGGTIANFEAL
jgi:tyrosine decarboxylase/aspartate 1-decarboxylase